MSHDEALLEMFNGSKDDDGEPLTLEQIKDVIRIAKERLASSTVWDTHTIYNRWGLQTDNIREAACVVSEKKISIEEILDGAPRLR